MIATEKPSMDFSEHELLASLCRGSFADFVREFWDVVVPEKLVWNWHMTYLCKELQKLAERLFRGKPKKYDLIINIAPGSSKSMIASVMFPAWVWTRLASARVISASYSGMLAIDLSRKSRDLIKSDKYRACFTDIEIREDQDSKGFFINKHGGERYAFGVGGMVTGKHAHFIIVDDPLNPMQSCSEAELKAANRWMEETLPSRKVNRLLVPTILIMQRLHESDPTGDRLRKSDKVAVKHICIPAELTDNVHPPFLKKYYKGGLMDPRRLPHKALDEAKAQGEFAYAAQYLQTPIPRGGAMFHTDKMEIASPPLKFRRRVRFWDKAGTQGDGHFTVGALLGEDMDGFFWVLNIVRGQWDASRREREILNTAKSDGFAVTIGIEQEPGSGGKESAEASVRRLRGYHVRLVKVGKSDGDKEQRADPLATQVNAGNVRIARGAWNDDYLNELKFFPRSRYKDQVDASSGAFNLIARPRISVGGIGCLRKMRGQEWKPKVDMPPSPRKKKLFAGRSDMEKGRK